MTSLGQLTKERQQAIVYVAKALVRKWAEIESSPSFLQRLDVANVPPEVMGGVFERLRYAGVRYEIEGRFLVVLG